MLDTVLLNNVAHKDLKVKTHYGEQYGGCVPSALTFPTEFSEVHREFPILFYKDNESGKLRPMALMGFVRGENLFIENDEWITRYIPATIAKGPFFIGISKPEQRVDDDSANPVIHINLDDNRVNESEGEPLFLEFGGNSKYLNRIGTLLSRIHDGMVMNGIMCDLFEKYDLFESVSLAVELIDGSKNRLEGNFTLNEDKLRALKGDALEDLNSRGFLSCAYLAIASLGNLSRLIDLKNMGIAKTQQ